MSLWSDPYYKFSNANKLRSEPITVDVTSSAGNFPDEIAGLADIITEFKDAGVTHICEVGAGKLRNTLFLLREKFAVTAVEHPQVFDRPQGKERFGRAKKYKRFVYRTPAAFATCSEVYDAMLLINVINIVPDTRDRQRMIAACSTHIRKGGFLVWMTQYGEPHYRRGVATRMRICDGYCYNLSHEYQSFVKEFEIPEIRAMLPSSQYRELRQLNVRFNHAFLYERK
jgi:2-polyprenyl-3-methyl-5-hydroxy-6-metoxy-1,4-benzoquinol methylase